MPDLILNHSAINFLLNEMMREGKVRQNSQAGSTQLCKWEKLHKIQSRSICHLSQWQQLFKHLKNLNNINLSTQITSSTIQRFIMEKFFCCLINLENDWSCQCSCHLRSICNWTNAFRYWQSSLGWSSYQNPTEHCNQVKKLHNMDTWDIKVTYCMESRRKDKFLQENSQARGRAFFMSNSFLTK